jgi:hypothetical protein
MRECMHINVVKVCTFFLFLVAKDMEGKGQGRGRVIPSTCLFSLAYPLEVAALL